MTTLHYALVKALLDIYRSDVTMEREHHSLQMLETIEGADGIVRLINYLSTLADKDWEDYDEQDLYEHCRDLLETYLSKQP